jgi:hypothetical protein
MLLFEGAFAVRAMTGAISSLFDGSSRHIQPHSLFPETD